MIVLANIKIVEKVMARTRRTNSAKVIPVIKVVTGCNKEEYGLAVDAIKKRSEKITVNLTAK